MSTCPVLDEERVKLYSDTLPTVRSQILDPRVDTSVFLEVMTGTCWVDDINVQKFSIHFLSKLRAARMACLVLLILGKLSRRGGKKEEDEDALFGV